MINKSIPIKKTLKKLFFKCVFYFATKKVVFAGKKPHNTFSLDIYRHANNFIENFIETTVPTGSQNKGKGSKKKISITLPQKVTRKTLHNEYKEYCAKINSDTKVRQLKLIFHV